MSSQKTMEPRFRSIVEHATGREVVVDLFVLAPGGEPLAGEHEQVLDEG